jgi:hypothetical protein
MPDGEPTTCFSSDRTFQLWAATVSHGQLLLRSPESDHESTRIDVAFKPVEALQLETTLNGLTIRHATGQERTRILSGLSESLDNRNVFICESRSTRDYVVAAVLQIVEDTLGYAAPSGAFDASFAF